MNSRQLGILSAIALAIVVGAVWIGIARTPRAAESDALYPALTGRLDAVTSVRVFKSGDELAVELDRNGSDWTVKQRDGYSADAGKANALLIALEGAKLREQKTSVPENYPALGIQDLSSEGATGSRVELTGVDPAVKLIVGKQDASQHGSFVRRAGETQSWLISEPLNVSADAKDWLQHAILDIGADRLQMAQLLPSTGPKYEVFKNSRADANFEVRGIPKGRELNSVSAANAVAQALVSLQLDDVQSAANIASNPPSARATYQTFDGLTLAFSGFAVADARWIVVKASVNESLAKQFHLPTAPTQSAANERPADEKSTDPAPTPEQSLAAALSKTTSESESINKRVEGWAFEVASYKYDAIFKPLDQLLKK